MAEFYSDEHFPLETVLVLRELGHDVLTAYEAGNANLAIADEDVAAYAISVGRIILTQKLGRFPTAS